MGFRIESDNCWKSVFKNLQQLKQVFLTFFTDGLMRFKGGRYFNYYALCVPWIAINLIGIVLDFTTSVIYYWDSNRVLWNDVNFMLDMLEVKNTEEVLQVIQVILEDQYILVNPIVSAAQFIALCASKFFVPLVILLMFGLLSIKSMWAVIAENKRIQSHLRRV